MGARTMADAAGAQMAAYRYLMPAAVAAVVLATWTWAPARIPSADPVRSVDVASPLEFTRQIEAMRQMHARVVLARSTEQRQALLDDSRQIMSAGVVLMRRMRNALPTTAGGAVVTDVLSDVQAQRMRDFLHLLELLVQMRADQETVPQAEPTPAFDSQSSRPQTAGAPIPAVDS